MNEPKDTSVNRFTSALMIYKMAILKAACMIFLSMEAVLYSEITTVPLTEMSANQRIMMCLAVAAAGVSTLMAFLDRSIHNIQVANGIVPNVSPDKATISTATQPGGAADQPKLPETKPEIKP